LREPVDPLWLHAQRETPLLRSAESILWPEGERIIQSFAETSSFFARGVEGKKGAAKSVCQILRTIHRLSGMHE
jgi:hypothetical protein